MGYSIGGAVPSHDVAARVVPAGKGIGSAREINVAEMAPAKQKGMGQRSARQRSILTRIRVPSHDVAASIDSMGIGLGSAGEVNRGERGVVSKNIQYSAQREAKCQ